MIVTLFVPSKIGRSHADIKFSIPIAYSGDGDGQLCRNVTDRFNPPYWKFKRKRRVNYWVDIVGIFHGIRSSMCCGGVVGKRLSIQLRY